MDGSSDTLRFAEMRTGVGSTKTRVRSARAKTGAQTMHDRTLDPKEDREVVVPSDWGHDLGGAGTYCIRTHEKR
jgi:hypothetical protein